MGRDFFFSYSSADYKPERKDDLFRFFTDLQEKLKDFGRDEGGYFAAKNNESGADWKDELTVHLKSCHVLVPLHSPMYFKSPHCGREWKVYYDRFQENRTHLPADVKRPEVILPVLWQAELLAPPPAVREIQDTTKTDYPDLYTQKGLSYLMRSPSGKAKYDDFVHKFGRRLAEMLNAQGEPKVRSIPEYDKIDPLFPADSKRGLTLVRFVFMAGLKDDMEARRPNWRGYGILTNRKDWQPCHPDRSDKAGEIASALATAAGKSFDVIEPGDNLLERLQYARQLENIVVIVVDPWSLDVPALVRVASAVDSEPLPNSALLVMWNTSSDPEPAAVMPRLDVPADPKFLTRESRKEPIVTVRSYDEFAEKLGTFFNTFRGAMMVSGKIKSAEQGGSEAQPILKG